VNAISALSIVTLALQSGAIVTAFAISRAPGWRRVRIVGVLAVTAGLYSLARLLGEVLPRPEANTEFLTRANVLVGALHLSAWLWYLYADDHGRWRSVPRSIRWLALGGVALGATGVLLRALVTPGSIERVWVPWLNLSFIHPRLSPFGLGVVAVLMVMILFCVAEVVRQVRREVPFARAMLAGFVFFSLCGFEEMAVAAGWFDFIYIGELGYLALVVPLTFQLLQHFTANAERLAELSDQLRVEARTAEHERDAARETFVARERFAALGRIASGVGHEINNPLQYLLLNLEELREVHLRSAPAEAEESLAQSFEAAERIRRIVEGMRAYARTTAPRLEVLDLRAIVPEALRTALYEFGHEAEVRQLLGDVPLVLGDRANLVQVVVNAVANATVALGQAAVRAPRIEVRTFTAPGGEAALEVRDNGPGFPADLLSRIGEPFTGARPTSGGSGLGLFVVRGIVAAHAGALHLENARGGGAVLRVLLPPAPEAGYGTTAVASISTTAPGSSNPDTSSTDIAG